MRKKAIVLIVLLLTCSVLFTSPATFAILNETEAEHHEETNDVFKKVDLTEEQQRELATLSQEILAKKKELVSKYVEFGVLSEERGEKVVKKMEEHYKELESNGFIPQWHHKSKKHKHRE